MAIKLPFTFRPGPAIYAAVMNSETFWSVAAMPIGLVVCFAPAIIAWIAMGAGSKDTSED